MADEVVIVFKADTGDLDKAVGKIEKLTNLQAQLKAEVSTTFSNKQLDEAIAKINKQADALEKLNTQYSQASKEVKQLEEEMSALASANAQGTKSFDELQKALSGSKATAKELGKAVKEAASKPEMMDSLVGSLKALKTAFSSAGTLVKAIGLDTQAYEKVAGELTATLQHLETAQSLMNAVAGESSFTTKALAAAQAAYTFVVGESTGAVKAFRISLAATGIGLAIIAIGELVANWDKVKLAVFGAGEAIDGLSTKQKQHNEILKQANQNVGDEIAHLKILQQSIQDEKLPRKERMEAVREYNKLAAEGNQIGEREIDMRGKINTQIGQQINLVLALATAKAAEDMLGQKITELLQLELKQRQDVAKGEAEIIAATQKMNEAARNDETGNMTAYFEQQKNTTQATTFFNKLEGEKRIADKKKEIEDLLELLKGYKREATKLEGQAPAAKRAPEIPVESPKQKIITSLKSINEEIQKEIDIQKIPVIKIDVVTPEEKVKAFMDKYAAAMQQTISAIGNFANNIFAAQTQALQAQLSEQLGILDEQKQKELDAAGNNAQLKQAIEERSAKKKADLEKKAAIEKAKIDRKQAITNKAIALFTIGINISKAVSEYIDGLPGTAALMAIAIATGAAEMAAVAAQPLPEIPKYEKGGPVALSGGRIADGHLYGRSHRQGGMLINAQGGEYIWDIATVQKHGDMIRAAHQNKLEDLILHKYIAPALQHAATSAAAPSAYDDFMLRATIKQTGDKNTQQLIAGITKGVAGSLAENIYLTNRYKK